MATHSLAHVKAKFSEIVASVQGTRERVVVTKNGEPAVVIIASDDLEALEETLALLNDPDAVAALREGEADMAAGNVHTLEDLERDLAERRSDKQLPT